MRRFLPPILIFTALAVGCSREPVEIAFQATWAGEPIRCEDAERALSDLRFYVTDLELVSANGKAHSVSELSLIDLESGLGACENGTTEQIQAVSGLVPSGSYRSLRFTLGVPFEANHADPLAAAPPLDDAAMHWHWRSGYKFLRAGVRTAEDGFWMHLGSAGCEGTVGNITGCRFPNRVAVELPDFDPKTQIVAVDLAALFAGIDLVDGEPGSCSSGPAESQCPEPFRALGLNFDTGSVIGEQQVFSASP